MSEIKIIEGEIFDDTRGRIYSLNNLNFVNIKRSYFISHPDINIIRGWHGHKYESKWFFCIKGSFTIAFIKIDNWDNPSQQLIPEIFVLSDSKSEIIYLPKGYANCIKANEPDSIMLVYSDKIYSEALNDSWRYDSKMWVNWTKF